ELGPQAPRNEMRREEQQDDQNDLEQHLGARKIRRGQPAEVGEPLLQGVERFQGVSQELQTNKSAAPRKNLAARSLLGAGESQRWTQPVGVLLRLSAQG